MKLHHVCKGEGPTTLLFHGSGLDHTYLRPWHDRLGWRAVYFDQRGSGKSPRVGPYDHATWQSDAIDLLDQLGESRALLYGHSYGSWLALGCALSYPERVAGLVLCATSPAFDYPDVVLANARARNPALADALFSALAAPVEDDATLARLWHQILPLYFAGPPRPEILENVCFGAQAFSAALAALNDFSLLDRLDGITVPTLILTGAHDFITPPEQGRRLASRIAGARSVELAGSGHFPFVEESDRYRNAIMDYVATL